MELRHHLSQEGQMYLKDKNKDDLIIKFEANWKRIKDARANL